MSIIRFRRAPLRAIYVMPSRRGGWFFYVTGYRPVARDTPSKPPHLYETRAQAEEAAVALHRRVGLPIGAGIVRVTSGRAV